MPTPIPFPDRSPQPTVLPTLEATITPALGVQIIDIAARHFAVALYLLEQHAASAASRQAVTHLRRAHAEAEEALLWQRRAASDALR